MSSVKVPNDIFYTYINLEKIEEGFKISSVEENVWFEGKLCTKVTYIKETNFCCPWILQPCEKACRIGVGLIATITCCCGIGFACFSEKCNEKFCYETLQACDDMQVRKRYYVDEEKMKKLIDGLCSMNLVPSVCAPQHQSMEVPAPPPSTPLLRNARIVAS